MTPGQKTMVGLGTLVGVGGLIILGSRRKAQAATLPPADMTFTPEEIAQYQAQHPDTVPPDAGMFSGTQTTDYPNTYLPVPGSTYTPPPSGSSYSRELAEYQRRLVALGYNVGSVDGRMGPNTRGAIMNFQGDVNNAVYGPLAPLAIDGILGTRTKAAINSAFGQPFPTSGLASGRRPWRRY